MGVGTIGPLILMGISEYIDFKELDFMFNRFVMPQGLMWVYIFFMGMLATLAQIYMTKAYGASKAGIVGTISYFNIIFSIILGAIFLGDNIPEFIKILGIIFIIISGILVARR